MNALVWEYVSLDHSGETELLKWRANSFYETDEGEVCYWEIFVGRNGQFMVDCSDYSMVDGTETSSVEFYDRLADAKEYCERLEYDLQCRLEKEFDVIPALQRREERNGKLVPA